MSQVLQNQLWSGADEASPQEPPPWGGREPRIWQRGALPIIMEAIDERHPGLVRAVMGAGKSILQAEVCARTLQRSARQRPGIIVTAPKQDLVRQLAKTFRDRCGPERVGVYYGHRKEPNRPIVIACDPSASAAVDAMRAWGRDIVLWCLDECHGSEKDEIKQLGRAGPLAGAPRIGFTATPFRAVRRESLELFEETIVNYTFEDAIREGVIIRPEYIHPPELDTDDPDEIDAMMVDMVQRCLDMTERWPGIVNATTRDDAKAFAGRLRAAGVKALAILGNMSRRARDEIIAKVEAREIECLVHCNLLSEGVDIPILRWIVLRRDTRSRVRFAQEVGRVMRAAPGKDFVIVADPHGLARRFDYDDRPSVGPARPTFIRDAMSDRDDADERPSIAGREPPRKRKYFSPDAMLDLESLWYRMVVQNRIHADAPKISRRRDPASDRELARLISAGLALGDGIDSPDALGLQDKDLVALRSAWHRAKNRDSIKPVWHVSSRDAGRAATILESLTDTITGGRGRQGSLFR